MKTILLFCLLIFVITPSGLLAQKKGERVIVTTRKADLKVDETVLKNIK